MNVSCAEFYSSRPLEANQLIMIKGYGTKACSNAEVIRACSSGEGLVRFHLLLGDAVT